MFNSYSSNIKNSDLRFAIAMTIASDPFSYPDPYIFHNLDAIVAKFLKKKN